MDLDLKTLQFLSFFGICRQTLGIVFSWRKYGVLRISLRYATSLSIFIFCLSLFAVSFRFTYEYQKNSMDFSSIILSHFQSTWFSYLLVSVFLPYVYAQSISSAVYSVALIFSGKEEILSPDDIKKIVQSVSKRVLTTVLWSVAITGLYTILGGFLAFFCLFFDCFRLVGAVILIIYFMGFVYISSVSLLAQVVSIMEDIHGLQAFTRSKSLIRGRLGLASAIFLLVFSCEAIIIVLLAFLNYYMFSGISPSALAPFFVLQALALMGSAMAILFLLVAQTFVYFVCRSEHDHDVEKSVLAGLLTNFIDEVYALIPSTEDEGPAEKTEKPSAFSWKNNWVAFLYFAICTSLLVYELCQQVN